MPPYADALEDTPPAVSPELLTGLNPAQQRAVMATEGPVLVVAGAGSGKTRVLTHRIAHLIRDLDVNPFELLAITFTNKAAGEMAARVGQLVGARLSERMWVTTFHKACVRILRRELHRLGYAKSFTIYDQQDSRRLIARIVKDAGIDDKRLSPQAIQHAISRAKDELIDHEAYKSDADTYPQSAVADVYAAYEERLRRANALDFDDLIVKTVTLLQLFDPVREHYQQRFRYLLVDEYQDTNRAQYHLVNLLAAAHRNVMVVGDPRQGIFAFRGATIQNLRDFRRDYPDATVIPLARNYRSTQTILAAANAVIRHNQAHGDDELWTDRSGGVQVVRYHADDEHDEAAFVAEEVERLRLDHAVSFDDVAIFYRTNAQSRVLEEVLVRVGTPYKVIGGVRFYERREIKDVLAYTRVLVNPSDDESAHRIVNTPRRGIGGKTVEAIDRHARRERATFLDACRHAEHIPHLGARAVGAVRDFVELVDGLRAAAQQGAAVPDLIEDIWHDSGYMREIQAERTIEALGREENLRELRSVAQEHHERTGQVGLDGVAAFLESVTLVSEQDELDGADEGTVTLMTLHNAKGLEYPVVFIVGLDDGVFPHVRSLSSPPDLEEERRLCYVGMTRAMDRLYLSHADHRTLWGGMSYNPASRFLAELPAELVDARSSSAGSAAKRIRDREVSSLRGEDFRVGDDVRHSRYGSGRIVAVAGDGENAEVTVRFDSEGDKHLLLAYAPLVKL